MNSWFSGEFVKRGFWLEFGLVIRKDGLRIGKLLFFLKVILFDSFAILVNSFLIFVDLALLFSVVINLIGLVNFLR